MRVGRFLVLAVAIGAGLIASLLVLRMGDRPARSDVAASQPEAVKTDELLVVARDIKLGQPLQPEDLKWVQWPSDALSEGAIVKASYPQARSDLIGRIARAPMYHGEPIREERLIATERGFMAAILPKGKRAIGVSVKLVTMAGGFVLPGDKVDVIVTRNNNGGIYSETVLENVRVLAIDDKTAGEQQDKTLTPEKTATLELTPRQTEIMARAQNMGTISLALRSAEDSEDGNDEPVEGRGSLTFVKYGIPSHAGSNQ
ncbi:Flp pilus assembly protein CpaB [Rhodobacteraceae bacterium RKSG542]|uniref:Flp pilus assembly protein CpaB n=1 Tax=Pseudovibrio flavus TaxID=2529854 RepID=UPI0012BD0916|nr:Flp pilus assembly protein CpaB [Pseudovibrio flavus]MTI17178.1 Flp pilus assembly protein CpaB [Pseudovibrio flavus]